MCFLLFFFKIGARDLWNPDEPRYAQVSREMLETGDWVVPHLNGDVYKEKPPLYFWLVALMSKPCGNVNETTARLPSALAATLVVLLTYFLGLKILGDLEAFLGAAMMATSAQFFWIGRTGALDALLTLCILAALVTFYFACIRERPLYFVLGYLFLIPAALTKGPVGVAIPIIVMLTFLLVEIVLREDGSKKRLVWFWAATLIGLLLVAGLVLPWLYAAYQRSGGVYGSLSELSRQTGGRVFKSYSHRGPVYYYLVEILWQFLPWTVFLPLTLFSIWRKGDLRNNRPIRFLVVWFASIFLFFTLISGKRSQYIMPLFPAAGLLLGWALTVSDPEKGRLLGRRTFWMPLSLIALGFAGGIVGFVIYIGMNAPRHLPVMLIAGLVCVTALGAIIWRCSARPPKVALIGIVALITITGALVFGYFKQIVELSGYASARPFCEEVLSEIDKDDSIFFYHSLRPNVHFYMHRRMPEFNRSNEKVAEALLDARRTFLVVEAGDMRRLEHGSTRYGFEIEELTHARVGSRDMIFVRITPAKTRN
jgi:4-amino-4-deoxy-L-arabinose transferase-like glycosyltransferase